MGGVCLNGHLPTTIFFWCHFTLPTYEHKQNRPWALRFLIRVVLHPHILNYKEATEAKILCQTPPCQQPAKSYKLLTDPMGLAYIGTSLPLTVSNVEAACKVLPHWSQKTITHCLSLFPIVSQLGYQTNNSAFKVGSQQLNWSNKYFYDVHLFTWSQS